MNIGNWVPAICPNCNATLSVTDNGKRAHCPYCGSDFLSGDGIVRFNATYMTNHITANTAYFGNGEKDFDIIAGTLVKYSGASVDIVIPDNVETIDRNVFSFQGIHSISIPASVTGIGTNAFLGCGKLTSVEMLGAEIIGEHAFDGCTNLINLKLPDTLKYIGEAAFKGTGVTTVSVCRKAEIGNFAFENTQLSEIYINEPAATFFNDHRSKLPFYGTPIETIGFTDFTLDLEALEWKLDFDDMDEYRIFQQFFRGTPFVQAMERRIIRCLNKGICPICYEPTKITHSGGFLTGEVRRAFRRCPWCDVEVGPGLRFYDNDPRTSCHSDDYD